MYSLRSTKLYKGLAFRRHTRGRDCEAGSPFPSASAFGRISSSELLDGTRDSVLALKNMQCFHMLRRCVSFSWAKPSVTKSSTHLFVFIVLFPTLAVLRAAAPNSEPRTQNTGVATPWFPWFLWLKFHVKLKKAYFQKEKG